MDAEGEIKEGDGIPALEVKPVKPGIPKKLPPGNAVQVVNLQDSPRAERTARVLRLNTQVLRDIVSKTENHPIAVIAIAGPARRGKSFMLSYIVRYLQALERCGNGDAGDWMEKSNPNKAMTDKGFAFRNGMDRTTDGIWMWTRPFIVKKSESEPPIAVLVMDTEGCFDPYSNEQEQSSVVGLSLLLSSCFIYNDSGLINESTIATLAKFMQYGQIASESFDGKVFQRLMFLIRDWSTSGFEHGAAGGQGFILKSLASNPRMSEQAKANRKLIQDNFEDYNAYLMPFPGKQVVAEEFTGSVGEMKEEFRSHVEKFVSHLIADVAPKKFANEPAVTDSFLNLFFKFVDSFNEDDMPSPVSIHSAMIYSAYDSQIRKLAQAFESEFQKKLSSGNAPFHPIEKLEKYHRRLKSSTIKSFASKKRLGSAEDAQLFEGKLAESIDLKFKLIMENNLNGQREFVGAIEKRMIQKVSEAIQELIMTSTKIWSEPEFQATLSKHEDDAVAQLILAAQDVPKELVKAQAEELRANVQNLKPLFWETLQQKRIAAEIKMSSILETFVASYNTWINVLVTDDDLLSDKKLEQSHKNKLLLLTTEFTKAAEEFNDEKFVQQFVTKLENQLEIEFQKVRQANLEKIDAAVAKVEEEVVEMLDVFKEESEKLFINASVSTTSLSELKNLYEDILQLGIQTIEDHGLPDAEQVSDFRRKLQQKLGDAFQQAQNEISQALAAMKQNCEESLNASVDGFTQTILAILKFDAVQSSELDAQINSVAQSFRVKLETDLLNMNVTDASLYLSRFDTLVAQNKQQQLISHFEKVKRFERQVEDRMRILKQTYNQEMKQLEQNWTCLDGLATSHQTISSELFLRLKDERPLKNYPNQQEKYGTILRAEIQNLYNPFHQNLEAKLEKFRQIQTQIIPGWVSSHKSDMLEYVVQNPLQKEEVISQKIDQEQKTLFVRIRDHIVQTFPLESPLAREAFKQFQDEMRSMKIHLMQEASTAREKANESIGEIIADCLTFADNHEAFQLMQTNFSTSSAAFQETIKTDVRAYFETLWNIPSANDEKEKTWEKIITAVTTKFQSVFEQLLSRSKEEKDIMRIISDSIMANFCPDVANFLSNEATKFYPVEALQELLNQAKINAVDDFKARLKDRGINPINKLEEIESQLESRVHIFLEENVQCIQIVTAEAKEISMNLYEAKRRSIKTQADLEKIREQVEEQSWNYIKERCFEEVLENHPAVASTFKEHSQEIYDEFLSSLEAETAQPEVRNKLIENAVKMYNDTMNKRLEGYKAVNPENLLDFHNFSIKAAQRKVGQTHFVRKELQEMIQERLQLSLQIFQDKNNIAHAQMNNVAIGIDLGTTTSCVAVYQNGQAHVIRDNSGRSLTPSCVFFGEDGSAIVGNEAKSQAGFHPESTIFDSKRLIGREFIDPYVQEDIKLWPFKVEADDKGKPKIIVRDMEFSPEGISAKVLMHMRRLASMQLNKNVSKAVITVPANFSDRQRDATRQAALIAGFEVLQIINEPTAAAMAYALNWKDEEKTVLVFDFGGGTFDVSILRTEGPPEPQSDIENAAASGATLPPAEMSDGRTTGSRLRVLHTDGDTHLGGEDCDSRMVEFCVEEFQKRRGIHLLEEANASSGNEAKKARNRRLRRLRTACEIAKNDLTAATTTEVHVDEISDGLDLEVPITRAQFERMNEDLFQKAIDIVRKALREARIHKQEITEVLMVGGSSRIPRVRKLLQDFLGMPSLNINQKVDIQEAVAMGAAVQACILNGGSSVGNLPLIKDIQPFSLGIVTVTGKMAVLISRNTYIPCTASESFRTAHENQQKVRIDIYAGEEFLASKNVPLGSFTLTGIPPGSAGSQTIEVKMQIDLSGILNVTATATSTGRSQNLVIEECRGRYTDEEITEMRSALSDSVR